MTLRELADRYPTGAPPPVVERRAKARDRQARQKAEKAGLPAPAAIERGKMAAAGPAGVKALTERGVKGATMAQAFDFMTMAMISPKDIGPGGKYDPTAMQQMASFIKTYSVMTGGPQTSASALISAGGADTIDNLRPAHMLCNVEKGDRLPSWWERQAAGMVAA
jgi:hypothetical protein